MKNKKGFSFLEMIIVVAIITIMTMTMFVVSFKDRDKKQLEAIGREVAAAIRETQNNSLTGRQGANEGLPCAFRFVNTDTGYRVEGSYREVDQQCGDDVADDSYAKSSGGRVFSEEDYAALNGLTIQMFTSQSKTTDLHESNYIVYVVPYGKYIDARSTDPVDPSVGVDVVVSKDGKKYHICVHAIGLIEEIGFNEEDLACAF